MSKKRVIILISIFVLLVICLFISISYSYYMIGNNKVEIDTVTEAPTCVGVSIQNNELFSLKGDYAVPITNAQFLNSKKETQDIYKYSFTINSSCEGQDLSRLEIGLVPLDGSTFPITELKYILIKTEDNNNSFSEDNIKSFNNENVKKLSKGMIKQLENNYNVSATHVYPVGDASFEDSNSVSYDLYVWIGSDTNNIDMDKDFKAAILLFRESTVLDVLLNVNTQDGELIHHTEEYEYGAKDDGYRYAGDDPNNFICFGNGSEKYNLGNDDTCPIENKYRIIGYVPVTLPNGKQVKRLKLIKAEYLTEKEFKEQDDVANSNTNYESIKRVDASYDSISGYKWNNSAKNVWEGSTLYNLLNSDPYLSYAFGKNWENKIEDVLWNVGGANDYTILPSEMYNEEINGLGKEKTVQAKIGLMYAHDYGFAATQDNWLTKLGNYNNVTNREHNWLFNGVYEWIISPVTTSSSFAFFINSSGSISNGFDVTRAVHAIRPVFYLKEDVNLIKSDIAIGSREKPFRINIGEMEEENKQTMIEKLIDNNKDNTLIKHTEDITNSAMDNGYRYSGANPNNYICFGIGSEDYNNRVPNATCDVKNKYRIIGYVPVTLVNDEELTDTYLIKVIKAEYLTPEEFAISKTGDFSFNSDYGYLKKVETLEGTIPGYHWNSTLVNDWESSLIFTSLNSESYLNEEFGVNWENKIQKVKWNVGGYSNFSETPQSMYEGEMHKDGKDVTVNALMGLMHAYDYGFASSQENWNASLLYFDNGDSSPTGEINTNRENNWLYNAVNEWTITRYSSSGGSAFAIFGNGHLGSLTVNNFNSGIRPSFYLKEDVNIKDSDADGSKEHPFRIAI